MKSLFCFLVAAMTQIPSHPQRTFQAVSFDIGHFVSFIL